MTNTETTTETIPPYLYDDLRPQGAIGDQCSMLLSAKKHDSLKSCFYDGDGLRISRKDNMPGGVTTYYVWDSENPTGYAQVVEEIENGQVVRRYGYGLFLENVDIWNGSAFNRFYVVRDGTNSIRMLLDSVGNVAAEHDYDAFGNALRSTINTPITTQNAYGFHSEYKDPTTGFVYLRARWYEPKNGRFLNNDSWEGFNELPQSLHKYVFVSNNAINHTDPSGLMYMGSGSLGEQMSVSTIMGIMASSAMVLMVLPGMAENIESILGEISMQIDSTVDNISNRINLAVEYDLGKQQAQANMMRMLEERYRKLKKDPKNKDKIIKIIYQMPNAIDSVSSYKQKRPNSRIWIQSGGQSGRLSGIVLTTGNMPPVGVPDPILFQCRIDYHSTPWINDAEIASSPVTIHMQYSPNMKLHDFYYPKYKFRVPGLPPER